MADLREGRIERFHASDPATASQVWVTVKDRDRYLMAQGSHGGSSREEWRSGLFVRRMLERGHWILLPPRAGRDPAPEEERGETEYHLPLASGAMRVSLPAGIRGGDAAAALAEIERVAQYLRARTGA